ncbi:basic proline-rich protein-like [Camelus dromedarius]|uniref:basic proline-rich protein-like n=1 Tax=Camelus dromedarius TaxID=9838 RepID=UPI00311A162F
MRYLETDFEVTRLHKRQREARTHFPAPLASLPLRAGLRGRPPRKDAAATRRPSPRGPPRSPRGAHGPASTPHGAPGAGGGEPQGTPAACPTKHQPAEPVSYPRSSRAGREPGPRTRTTSGCPGPARDAPSRHAAPDRAGDRAESPRPPPPEAARSPASRHPPEPQARLLRPGSAKQDAQPRDPADLPLGDPDLAAPNPLPQSACGRGKGSLSQSRGARRTPLHRPPASRTRSPATPTRRLLPAKSPGTHAALGRPPPDPAPPPGPARPPPPRRATPRRLRPEPACPPARDRSSAEARSGVLTWAASEGERTEEPWGRRGGGGEGRPRPASAAAPTAPRARAA